MDIIIEALKKYGINSPEEFERVMAASDGLDLSIFVQTKEDK